MAWLDDGVVAVLALGLQHLQTGGDEHGVVTPGGEQFVLFESRGLTDAVGVGIHPPAGLRASEGGRRGRAAQGQKTLHPLIDTVSRGSQVPGRDPWPWSAGSPDRDDRGPRGQHVLHRHGGRRRGRYEARVSLATGTNPDVDAAIAGVDETAWTAIHYPTAFVDIDTGELTSDAQVGEESYRAFVSKPPRCRRTAG